MVVEAPLEKARVLIAEDAPIQAKKLQFYLEKYGYEVSWGKNGVEALELLKGTEFDLVMTDVQMPEMDGLQLLAKIRENVTTKRIPVVVLTTLTEEEVCLSALRLGASDFLTKPFRPEEVKLRAKNLISLYRFEKLVLSENFQLNQAVFEKNKILEKNLDELAKAHEKLKATQQQLVQASKLASLGVLGKGIAHEINTPLGVIGICADFINETLREGKLEAERIKELNLKIRASTDKIATIVNHVKIFGRSSDDKQAAKRIDLNAILENLGDFYAEYTKDQKVELVKKFSKEPLYIFANPIAIEHIFLNLIHNALDAVAGRPIRRIEIITGQKEGYALAAVKDTGCGIPPENLSKIYDPFFTTKEPGAGVGLGLSVVRAYLNDCHGKIDCKSSEDGTTFLVKIASI